MKYIRVVNVIRTNLVPINFSFFDGRKEWEEMTKKTGLSQKKLAKSGTGFASEPLKDKIGNDLKRLYDDVVNEDVPDDFLALLGKADQADH